MKFILKTLGIPVLFLIVASCSTGQGLFGRGSILDKEGTSDLVKVPVRVSRNVFFVDVEIEGETYNFLFDSGAPMVISPEIMEKHGAIVLREANVTDSQGAKVKQEFVKMPNFAIGDREFSGLTAVVSDLKRSPIIRCLAIDGILGANAMQFQYWDFSHKDSILQMSNSKRHWQLDTAKTYRLPWSFKATRTPKVQLTINGKVIEDITFDTGSGGVLGLHESIIGPLDLENAEFMAQGHLSGGLFGSAVDTAYTFSLPIHFPDTSYMFQVEQVTKGKSKLLGMGFFKHFHVYLDYPGQAAYLVPVEVSASIKKWPLSPYFRDGAIIIGQVNSFLEPNRLKLVVGDTITSINDFKVPLPATADDFCKVLTQFNGENLSLEISRKGVLELEAKILKP